MDLFYEFILELSAVHITVILDPGVCLTCVGYKKGETCLSFHSGHPGTTARYKILSRIW